MHYIKKGLQYSLTKKKKITISPQIILKNKGNLKVRLRANNRQMTLTLAIFQTQVNNLNEHLW